MPTQLQTGAELRMTGPGDAVAAVVCVDGGQGGEVDGTWSASLEVRYRVDSSRSAAAASG